MDHRGNTSWLTVRSYLEKYPDYLVNIPAPKRKSTLRAIVNDALTSSEPNLDGPYFPWITWQSFRPASPISILAGIEKPLSTWTAAEANADRRFR
ncbi:hypothetical protein [Actinokineospora sp. NBRC 105648]|uniref:hypothetical protein n=1 Tax=Actinokineospora sp. NBRC 105648 TaxID=3032206 RepID=UPI00249FF2D2|nr:hypothetical protein [Actinokineospora sp. NBRC 105648]GLZ42213.1 hypothetical protein Acsp05_58370 [Actinokineospora sp. NBRC 105648]